MKQYSTLALFYGAGGAVHETAWKGVEVHTLRIF